jgi:three-Cys-motif partner protein
LILIDSDQKALTHLRSLQPIRDHHQNVEVRILQGEFASHVEDVVSYLRKYPSSPTFNFVDPFGFGQSPLDKLKLLMHNEHSELFVNFWCGYMNRFKEHGNEEVVAKIKAMISATGCDVVREVRQENGCSRVGNFRVGCQRNRRVLEFSRAQGT